MFFKDKKLMKKYLIITKDILMPSLNSQINKNFIWGLLIKKEDVEFIRNELNYDFVPFYGQNSFIEYVINNNFNIQTRHDIDDWMSDDYINEIQKLYIDNIDKKDNFLIQSQPIKFYYKTKIEKSLKPYTEKRNSMHLSLCQKNVKNHIFERKHGQMFEISNNVITLPEGHTKWVIHDDNISVKKKYGDMKIFKTKNNNE